ncbi:MAG: OmcA/MtrC family decaheme c-type cytochrome, partial [Planctomycetes bacterium]|nr:OmcA/MtrC family decaheme c-type cytochrome [Planctomycetota bacterium]
MSCSFKKFFKSPALLSLTALGILLLLAMACGGSDGAAGAAGAAGASSTGSAGVYKATIDSVSIKGVTVDTTAHTTTVKFTLSDSDGILITTVASASSFRFALAQLIPGTATTSNAWQSYYSRTRSSSSYDAAIQATYESASSSRLSVALDGTWSYVFSYDVQAVTSPVAVTYDASRTHRVAMQVTGLSYNPIYDFRPDGGVITETRDIVIENNCNECHTKLEFHGGGRNQTKYCVVCHNPGTKGVSKNNDHPVELDMQAMIHSTHRGDDLPSNVAGEGGTGAGNYTIVGYSDSLHSYDDIKIPWYSSTGKPAQDCTLCHRSGSTTADYGNYKTKPSRANCGSCHNTVNFATGEGHSSGNVAMTSDSQCATCHDASYIESKHVTQARKVQEKAKDYDYIVHYVGNVSPGDYPKVTFSMVNPTNRTAPYDVTSTASGNDNDIN